MEEPDGAPDALFFHQLLLPMHDTKKTVEHDPRLPFYYPVARWSNGCAFYDLDSGSGCGHSFKSIAFHEAVNWDGVVVMDGALGGSSGAILRRFDDSRPDNTCFSSHIAEAFTKSRYPQIKRVIKLCDNQSAPRRNQPGYDPAYTCDYVFKAIVHNTNAITEKACDDQCGDETTFPHVGYGPGDGSCLVKRQINKPVTKGAQIVMVSDVDRCRPRACVHRHKLHENEFSTAGASEVKLICDKIKPMVHQPIADENVDPSFRPKAIFQKKPCFTFDNYFSGDQVMHYAAEEGFGLTMTCARGKLPRGVKPECWHKISVSATPVTRAARWLKPIFAIKEYKGSMTQCTRLSVYFVMQHCIS